jgi:hypothetical protein
MCFILNALQRIVTVARMRWVPAQPISAYRTCSTRPKKIIHSAAELSKKKSMETVLHHDFGGQALISLKKKFAK